jgi:hypothetical protein
MPAVASTRLYPHRSEREVKLVVDHQQIAGGSIRFAQEGGNCSAALVHKGLRLCQNNVPGVDASRADEAMGFLARDPDLKTAGKFVRCHKTGVVTRAVVLFARVSEAHDDFHRSMQKYFLPPRHKGAKEKR